jgi:hypothetical protein
MNETNIFSEKKIHSEKIKNIHTMLSKCKPLWLIILTNNKLTFELIEWLKTLQSCFFIYIKDYKEEKISDNIVISWKIDEYLLSWYDFIICDDEINNLSKYLAKWIVPIIHSKNHMSSILKEFNPLKNEWNAFFYDDSNVWNIFYSTVRYLENYKFPFDNKNLVNNLLKV